MTELSAAQHLLRGHKYVIPKCWIQVQEKLGSFTFQAQGNGFIYILSKILASNRELNRAGSSGKRSHNLSKSYVRK